VHTAHTLAKVKNKQLAEGDKPEPMARVIGEEQVVAEADRLVANTPSEAADLIDLYRAPTDRVTVVEPGVDLETFTPAAAGREAAAKLAARAALGLPSDGYVVAFVGRIQPLKAPDLLLQAAAELRARDPEAAGRLTVAIVGGNSGSGLDLATLAGTLGVADRVRFLAPRPRHRMPDVYRAADLVAVPSYNESFGLVALEAQACGTPVVAAAVGGLVLGVRDGISGVLVDGHDAVDWARVVGKLLGEASRRAQLARGAVRHAQQFSWSRTAAGLLAVYRDAVAERRARRAAELSGTAVGATTW